MRAQSMSYPWGRRVRLGYGFHCLLAEFAGLRVSDIREDDGTHVPLTWFTCDTKAGRRLKTKSSERVLPVHPQLIEIGFLKYVAERRKEVSRLGRSPPLRLIRRERCELGRNGGTPLAQPGRRQGH